MAISRIIDAAESPFVIAIDGRSGAGKTSWAERLSTELNSPYFSLEDVYQGWSGLLEGVAEYVENVLKPLKGAAGVRNISWNTWDWSSNQVGVRKTLKVQDILIVEGVGAGAAQARPYLDYLLWLEAPAETRKERAISRDGDTFAPFWDHWSTQEERLFSHDRVRENADYVVDDSAQDSAETSFAHSLRELAAKLASRR